MKIYWILSECFVLLYFLIEWYLKQSHMLKAVPSFVWFISHKTVLCERNQKENLEFVHLWTAMASFKWHMLGTYFKLLVFFFNLKIPAAKPQINAFAINLHWWYTVYTFSFQNHPVMYLIRALAVQCSNCIAIK